MTQPKRHGSTDFYRYGFQGQEKDDEVKGEGNSLNYKYRMHDPRIGRFFATDPLESKYPYYSPYQFSGNRLIDMVELEGLEPSEPGSVEGESSKAENRSKRFYAKTYHNGPTEDYIWHEGGVESSDGNSTKAGWYTVDSYIKQLESVINSTIQIQGDGVSGYSSVVNKVASEKWKDFVYSRNFAEGSVYAITQVIETEAKSKVDYKNAMSRGNINPMGFDSPFFILGGTLKALLSSTSTRSVTFYTVQGSDDFARLLRGGSPWPNSASRAHFGEGLYAWADEVTANSYLTLKRARGFNNLEVVSFNVSRYHKLKTFDFTKVSLDEGTNFMLKHSKLFGGGIKHNFEHIIRPTNFGNEFFFSKSIFSKIKF